MSTTGGAAGGSTAGPTGIVYERVWSVEGYHEVEALQQAVWGIDPLDTVPLHMLMTAHKNGGLLIAARAPDGQMVGFVFGFIGRMEEKYRHCSHMAGVLAEWRSAGIGERLKWLQAEAVREQGLDLVTWTFDPGQAANAHLNLRKLGGISRTYTVNLYGPMTDSINQGSDTDRLTVEWWLDSERVRRRRLGVEPLPTYAQLVASGAEAIVEAAGEPAAHGWLAPRLEPDRTADTVLVETPAQFVEMKREAPELARAWREAIRAALLARFAAGWVAVDFVSEHGPAGRRGFYVLRHEAELDLPPRLKV